MQSESKPVSLDISKIHGRGLIAFFLRAYPKRTFWMVLALLVASLFEGLGLMSLVPLIELATRAEASEMTPLARYIEALFDYVGLNMTIGGVLLLTITLIACKSLFLWLSLRAVGYTIADVTTDLRLVLLKNLMSVNWRYYVSQPVGRITNSLGFETSKSAGSYQHIAMFFAGMINVCVYAVVAFFISWQVVAIALVCAIVFVLCMRSLVSISRETGYSQARLMKSLSGRLTDMLHGIKPLIAMGKEGRVLPFLQQETRELNTAQRRQVLAKGIPEVLREPIVVGVLALLLYLSVGRYDAPFSTVILLALLFQRVVLRLTMLQSSYQSIVIGEGAFRSLQAIFDDLQVHRAPPRDAGAEVRIDRGIQLDHLTFGYDEHSILEDVMLDIPAGKFVTIEGPSGTGKTTLLDLLLGLHVPDAGAISIDGIPLNKVNLSALRATTGYVPQEMYLFNDTIFSNITLGDPMLGREDCERALKSAGALEFVSELPQGMETPVGERGTRLSGGQRQRIALARALVGRPRLLILDEVTSGLDPISERHVCETLAALRGQVTIIAVTHQPALAAVADVVYRLQDHKLVRVDHSARKVG
jgi:ATP-binding cassette, subfamily C, bacterial